MTRTTLDLDRAVLRELRDRGEREGKSMGRMASELLAAQLAEPRREGEGVAFGWTSRDLGAPRVDLEDKEALHALIDERS